MLILISLTAYGAFVTYVGDPGASECAGGACQSEYTPLVWVLAFGGLIGAFAVAGMVVGSILAFIRRGNRPSLSAIADQMHIEGSPDMDRETRENRDMSKESSQDLSEREASESHKVP